jgi:predicted RNA binding protein YcfA (HicA-like mRNA interferase family)
MNSAEIVRRLELEGWRKAHQADSHIQFKHPEKPGAVTVPHPRKTFPLAHCAVFIGRPVETEA